MRREAGESAAPRVRVHLACAVAVSALVAAMVLYATRDDPLLSPDSITYLSVAHHLRQGRGFVDFTGEPMAVFGPVYPLLLLPGGRSVVWAAVVGAAAAATAALLMFLLLRRHLRPWAAVVGATALGASQGLLRVSATAWSEGPYIAVSLGVLVVLSGRSSQRRAALGGALAGVGFLTRYAGLGLVATGALMVVVATWGDGWGTRARRLAAYTAASVGVAATWVVRNLVETGEALGPRFSGGTTESARTLLRRPLVAVGELVVGGGHARGSLELVGGLVALGVLIAVVIVARRRPCEVADVGVVAFAVTSLVVPVLARLSTSSDIESRVMSPMVVPVVYLAARVLDRRRRAVASMGVALAACCVWQGVASAHDFPDRLAGSAGNRQRFAPELYDLVEALPANATVLTDHTHRMWWHGHHDPVIFAFVKPRPGNSHHPISPQETLALSCRPDTYLAWVDEPSFDDDSPFLRRPDLEEYVELALVDDVRGGALYRVTPRDPSACP